MLAAVLYDLDGTLLDIDLDVFFSDYFRALGPAVARASAGELDAQSGMRAVLAATEAMCASTDRSTNREVFERTFFALTGVDLAAPDPSAHIARFYEEEFPVLGAAHRPKPGGAAAVHAARKRGLKVALATNPLFPRAAIVERLRWAGLSEDIFDVITSYECMHACKPAEGYFLHTAELLGVDAADCLMVGDDDALDMPAASVGMRTYYVGDRAPRDGGLDDLARALESGALD